MTPRPLDDRASLREAQEAATNGRREMEPEGVRRTQKERSQKESEGVRRTQEDSEETRSNQQDAEGTPTSGIQGVLECNPGPSIFINAR